ncbi:MAG: hypothetical protein ABSC22_02390 [Roseiarcus sp.]|jgi:hypothetical protein
MAVPLVSRRAAFAALAGACAWPALARADAAAGAAQRFRAIEVDVGPARELGAGVLAEWIAHDLPAFLRQSFAAHLAPGDRNAAILRARIDSVTLGAPNTANFGLFGGGGDDTIDYIEGAGVVVGAAGREIASYPLLCSLRASTRITDPEGVIARQRVSNLAQSFAQWLPGKMGL